MYNQITPQKSQYMAELPGLILTEMLIRDNLGNTFLNWCSFQVIIPKIGVIRP